MASLSEQFASPSITRYFRHFWKQAGARILVASVLAVLVGWVEALGIALLFPLFSSGTAQGADTISRSFSRLIDAFHVQHTPAGVLPLIVGLFVGKGLLLYLGNVTMVVAASKVTRAQRCKLLEALGRAQLRYLGDQSAGHVSNLVVNEVARASLGLTFFVRTLSPAINAGVLFVVVLVLDWRLTSVCVAMGLVMVGFTRMSGGAVRRNSRIASDQSSAMSSLVVQVFQAAKYLRATAGFDVFERRITRVSDEVLAAEDRAGKAGSVGLSLSQPILIVFLSGLLYYRSAVRGESLGSLFVVLVYFLRIMTELFMLQSSWQSFCSYVGSVDVVREAIDKTELRREVIGRTPYTGLATSLRCDGVSFAYEPSRPVLREITIEIPCRTTVAFVGSSGSGKSTLVDLLTGTLAPDVGTVRIDDMSLGDLDLKGFRRRIGYVAQEAIVFDDTVANNIALWNPGLGRDHIERAAERAHAAEFIANLPRGYDATIGDRGSMLSGGQRQRLAIARELVKSPDLLILDEATSALDSASERAIQSSIDELKGKMTILIIAHRLSTVRSADCIFVLHDGHIAEQGSYDELVRAGGRFKAMVDLQSLAP